MNAIQMKSEAGPEKKLANLGGIRRVHYVLSSHWDREWYQTFQDYRRRLVHLLDRVLEDTETGALKGPFTTDGQSIVLDDYLEIRPKRRGQIEEYAKAGKLKIGPWYVMPDEWLVSGEALIRNLRLGRQIARDYGATPSNAGFVCDLFGHISQLPQILKGFGILGGFIWRGIEPRKSAHVIWQGADGTRLPCFRFGRAGYCDYSYDVRHSYNDPSHSFDAKLAYRELLSFLGKEADRTRMSPLLVFDGGDHLEYDEDHYRLLFSLKPSQDFPFEVVHSTLDAYLEEMLSHEHSIDDVYKGELREVGKGLLTQDVQWLTAGVLASRVWIKQCNAECQALLTHWAEPFSTVATLFLGKEYPDEFLAVAWRWLLQNHPHDSIGGCSIDAVHEDMKYRFAQSKQIAAGQTEASLNAIGASIVGEVNDKELRVVVSNPLAVPIKEVINLVLQIPTEWGSYSEFYGFEAKPGFRIFDAEGNELPYQLLSQAANRQKKRIFRIKYPEGYKTNDVTVAVSLMLPPLGYATLIVREAEWISGDRPIASQMTPTRYCQTPSLATGLHSMENEFLRIVIESNGTLTVTDKRSGEIYCELLTFENSSDIGDGWYHGPPVNDQAFVSSACNSEIARVCNGAQFCQFRIRTVLSIPEAFDFGKMERSETLKPLMIDSLVGLRAGCDRLEIRTTVINQCKDHRLRVLFPTKTKATTYCADSAFDVVERNIALPADNHLGRELSIAETPQQTWTSVSDGKRGLALLSTGLLETAVWDSIEKPVALTLFRSTRRTVYTDGEPNGQLQGDLNFEYWVKLFSGEVSRHELCNSGIQLAAGFKSVQLRPRDIPLHRHPNPLPPTASLVEIKGNVVLSSIRQVGDAMEIRLFNPYETSAPASLHFEKWPLEKSRPKSAVRVNFESAPTDILQIVNNSLNLIVKPKEIVTFSIK